MLKEWSRDGTRIGATSARCPYEDETWHKQDVLCPYGFWGLKHVIEQPLSPIAPSRRQGDPEFVLIDAVDQFGSRGRDPAIGIGLTSDTALNTARLDSHIKKILEYFSSSSGPATTREALREIFEDASIGYFLCHGQTDTVAGEAYLGLGPNPGEQCNWVYPTTVTSWARSAATRMREKWSQNRPLLIINGCHTADLAPGDINNFVNAFATLGASGVIGTEVSVQLPTAMEVADGLIQKLMSGCTAGQALYEVRWELANKGNLLGLAYTLHGLADLRKTSAV